MNNQTEPILIEYGCNKPKIYLLLSAGIVFLVLATILCGFLYSQECTVISEYNDLIFEQEFDSFYLLSTPSFFEFFLFLFSSNHGILGIVACTSYAFGFILAILSVVTALQTWKSHITVTPQRIYGIGNFGKEYDIPTSSITMSERNILGTIVIHNGENVIKFSNIQYNDIIAKTISQLLSSNIPPILFPLQDSSALSQVTAPQIKTSQINEPDLISAPVPSYDQGIGDPDEVDDPNLS